MQNHLSVDSPAPRRKPRQANRGKLRLLSPDWDKHLPNEWRHAVEAPLHIEQYSEYEMSAERVVGYDADEQPCYTAHQFLLTRLASDDDEEFYEVVSYCEEMAAWRLRDERWLIFRITSSSNCTQAPGFYALSQDMPR
jgi:hypothetical protein